LIFSHVVLFIKHSFSPRFVYGAVLMIWGAV